MLFIVPRLAVFAVVIWSVGIAGAQVKHWAITPNETIWRDRYTNCDKGYAVDLPAGVVAHASLPPNPNHGFLISASDPGTTLEVILENRRIVDVYDEYDSMEVGSARAYLGFVLKQIPIKTILQIREIMFQGLRAVEARYRVKANDSTELKEELIIYRKSGNLIYVLMLRTTAQHYTGDSALFAKIRAGFHLRPIPKGECSNQ